MKIVIVGAGATGGFLGARLARGGSDVTLVARGPHLRAMLRDGVRVVAEADEFVAHPECTDDMAVVASADVVFMTVKAHALTQSATAELFRIRAIDMANTGASLKFNANHASDTRRDVTNMFKK